MSRTGWMPRGTGDVDSPHRTATEPVGGRGRIELGQPVTMGPVTGAQLMALAAAAAPPGSRDPVDVALLTQARALAEGPDPGAVSVDSFEPAVPARRVSVTQVRGPSRPDGQPAPVTTILRGDLRAVTAAAALGADHRLLLQTNAGVLERRGYRPLAVASSTRHADGTPGSMVVQGFVPVRTAWARGVRADTIGRPEEWVRVPVWPATLRWLHWLNVAAIVVLTATGLYIAEPFLRPGATAYTRTGFFMGYVRLVHYSVAWAWVTVGAIRLYLLFFSRDRYVRWPTLWPLKNRRDARRLGQTLSAYLLIHPDTAPTYIAHNPLQQLTYSGIYVMSLLQVVTGLALYGLYNARSTFWKWFEFPVTWFGAPDVRLIHYVLTWLFWVFVVLHVYLSVRADTLDRNGGLSSIISGGVWLRRGSHPVDDPSL